MMRPQNSSLPVRVTPETCTGNTESTRGGIGNIGWLGTRGHIDPRTTSSIVGNRGSFGTLRHKKKTQFDCPGARYGRSSGRTRYERATISSCVTIFIRNPYSVVPDQPKPPTRGEKSRD